MSDSDKLKRLYRSFPKIFRPEQNPVLNSLLRGFAEVDDEILTQLNNTKAQLFIRTAEGEYLNKIAASLGVAKPTSIGLTDEEFQQLIPNLSLKHKQIRKTFYDTMDIFWGPTFSRANLISNNYEPYNIVAGDEFIVSVDGGDDQTVKLLATDDFTSGAATNEELVAIFNERLNGLTAEEYEDPATLNMFLSIRTNTPGLRGSIQIKSCSMVDPAKLDFDLDKIEIFQQTQRSIIYEINPNEIIIEIPAIVPALRRTLKGSHHFHTDGTLEGPVPTSNGIWEGSFLFETSGETSSFTLSGQNAEIQEVLSKGNVYTKVTVDDNSSFEDTSGYLMFGCGTDHQEFPVKYRGLPNSNTVLLDPSYIFQYNQPIGTYINVMVNQKPFRPDKTGEDLPVYLTSPSDAREVVQAILQKLAAAGIILTFVILAPDYKYLIDNPYLSEDDA